MFFESVKIKKTAWHYKVMAWFYGENEIPRRNFCPYFWMTILALFLAPFKLVLKGIFSFFNYFSLKLEGLLWGGMLYDDEALYYGRRASWGQGELIGGEWDIFYKKRKAYEKAFDRMNYYYHKLGKGDLLDKRLEEIDAKREERRLSIEKYWEEFEKRKELEKEAREKRERERAAKMVSLQARYAKWGKFIGKVFGAAIVVLGLWGLYELCLFVWNKFDKDYFLGVLLGLGIIVGCALAIIFLIRGILFLWEKIVQGVWKRWIQNYGEESRIYRFFKLLFNGAEWVFKGIWGFIVLTWRGILSFFGFFWTMFMSWKNNNCPGIDWEE
jgi:hypothetical protein